MNLFRRLANIWKARPGRTAAPSARLELEGLEERWVPYSASGSVWPAPQLITISFVPDGTSVNGTTSNLFATFNAKFGTAATWQNQILKAAQYWAQQTNINFAVVADNGAATGSGSYQQGDPGFGDIRISGYNFGNSTIAQGYLPPPANNYSVAGDFQFNTGQTFNIGSTYDLFSVAVHEFGHVLGLYHSTTSAAVMYATYGLKSALNADDISGIKALYSSGANRANDSYDTTASNGTFAASSLVTSAINTTTKAGVVYGDLSTSSDIDYYKFVAPAGSSTTLKAKIITQGFSLMNPKVEIIDSANKVKATATAATTAYGTTITATWTGVAAGQTWYVKVSSTNSLAAFKTGKYALVLNMGTGADPAPTYPAMQTANGNPLVSGGGQAVLLGGETRVNTTTTDVQFSATNGHRAVASDDNGNYVVVWTSTAQDGSGYGIYAQRYNREGVAQGGEFRVNTTTVGSQCDPSVAMDKNGTFVVVWTGDDVSGSGIFAQRFNANGTPAGSEFRVNTTTADNQEDAAVSMDRSGSFVVTWTSTAQDPDASRGIYAQRYQSGGGTAGGEFRVNTTTAGNQMESAVALDLNGNFIVAWASNGQDGNGLGVYAQRYNAQGVAQGGEFRANTYTTGDQTTPTVATDRSGNFGIAWASSGQDGSGWGIYGQRYLATGAAVGTETAANTTTAGDQLDPSAGTDSNGNIFVTWASNGQDGSGWGIYGQNFNATTGLKLEGEIRINSTTAGDQRYASLAFDPLGQAVIVWSGNVSGDPDGIAMQRVRFNLLPFDPLGHDHDEHSPATEEPSAPTEPRWSRAHAPASWVWQRSMPLWLGQPTPSERATSALDRVFADLGSTPSRRESTPLAGFHGTDTRDLASAAETQQTQDSEADEVLNWNARPGRQARGRRS